MAWTQAMETSQGWWVDLSCSNILVLQIQCELLKMKNVKVGMVQRGEVDIGGGMFSLMKERAVNFKCSLTKIFNLKKVFSLFASFQEVVDFSNGISVEENTILMKTPR